MRCCWRNRYFIHFFIYRYMLCNCNLCGCVFRVVIMTLIVSFELLVIRAKSSYLRTGLSLYVNLLLTYIRLTFSNNCEQILHKYDIKRNVGD